MRIRSGRQKPRQESKLKQLSEKDKIVMDIETFVHSEVEIMCTKIQIEYYFYLYVVVF